MTRTIHELAAQWQVAEDRLYPIALTRPETYARSLEAVRAIAEELAPYGTVEALAHAYVRADEIAARAVERSHLQVHDVDLGLATGAAFALRYRFVSAAVARADALARIGEARDRGDEWVTVTESGDPVGGPYRRLELHVADGDALEVSITFDAETGEPRYGVEAFQVDPRTGDRLPSSQPIAPARTFTDEDEWRRATEELRARLEGSA